MCFWRIFVTDSTSTGIFVELEFMDSVLMFGQVTECSKTEYLVIRYLMFLGLFCFCRVWT